jgi:hypothetical protein
MDWPSGQEPYHFVAHVACLVCVAVDTAVPGSHALLDLGVTSPSPPPVKREPAEHKALLHGIIGQHPHMAHRPAAYTTSTTGKASLDTRHSRTSTLFLSLLGPGLYSASNRREYQKENSIVCGE